MYAFFKPGFLIKVFLFFPSFSPDNKYSSPLLCEHVFSTAALPVWADFTYLALSFLEIIKQMTIDELYLTVQFPSVSINFLQGLRYQRDNWKSPSCTYLAFEEPIISFSTDKTLYHCITLLSWLFAADLLLWE